MLLDEHGGAIDYDLMTRTTYTVDDIGEALSLGRLASFVDHLDASSALVRELYPESAPWAAGDAVARILADIYDCINALRYQHAMANRDPKKKTPPEPVPYPRPGQDKEGGRKVGRDPIPVAEFEKWWEEHTCRGLFDSV